jgi:uncharacterized protein YcfL
MKKLFILMLSLVAIAGCATNNDGAVTEPKEEKQYVTGRLIPTKDKGAVVTTTGEAILGGAPNSSGKPGN